MKRTRIVAALLALTLTLCAWPAMAETAVDATRTGTLRILYPGTSGIEQAYMEKVKERFQQQYPNVTVEIDYLVWTDLQTKFTVMVQNNDWPDIVTTQDFTSYLAMGVLDELNAYFDDTLPLENFSKVGLEYTTVDGKIYSVPIGMNNWLTSPTPPFLRRSAGRPRISIPGMTSYRLLRPPLKKAITDTPVPVPAAVAFCSAT